MLNVSKNHTHPCIIYMRKSKKNLQKYYYYFEKVTN